MPWCAVIDFENPFPEALSEHVDTYYDGIVTGGNALRVVWTVVSFIQSRRG